MFDRSLGLIRKRHPTRALLLLAMLIMATFAASRAADTLGDPGSREFWYGTAQDGSTRVRLHYFYSPTCPHCQEAKPLLDSLPTRFAWLEIVRYSVKDDRDNARFYYQTAQKLGVEALSVPGFVYCGKVRIGFDTIETSGADLVRELEQCHAEPAPIGQASAASATRASGAPSTTMTMPTDTAVYVPLIGRVEAQQWSLPVLTLVLAGADAFNPCAFFVLLFLLSLLVHARSRTRMLMIGGTFVLFSGLIYFVFMAAWLNLFLLLGELRIITIFAGLLALVAGALNVKDYFWFRQGPTLSIPDSAKPGLFKRMREIVAGGAIGPMLAGTVVLAVVANSYELLCTAGFPMVYTRALTLAELGSLEHYGYLALYNLIYILPLLAIVLVFTYTMGARKLSEGEGRLLKLASGYMMLGFAIVLLIAPHQLTNAISSLGVLAAAILLTIATPLFLRLVNVQRAG